MKSMPNRISKIADSLKQLGEIQVTEWDLMGLLNTDIKELAITRSLRRLGNIQVMEWDFRNVLPAVNRFAHQEVDLIDFFKRAAHYKVMEWDFRNALPSVLKSTPPEPALGSDQCLISAGMQEITGRLKDFLQYVVANLIDEPDHALIKVTEIGPGVLRFELVLVRRDVVMLIGRQGFTASAIRGVLKSAARMQGVHALLQIHSHEEKMALLAKEVAMP